MSNRRAKGMNRREFLGRLTLAGTGGLLGLSPGPVAAEPPPEMTRIRLHKMAGICIAPQYVAEEFLYLEGFPEVQYVEVEMSGVLRHTKLAKTSLTPVGNEADLIRGGPTRRAANIVR